MHTSDPLVPASAGPRERLRALFDAAVAAAQPARTLAACLPQPPRGRTVVVGAGKASAAMAQALEAAWPVQAPLGGVVVTRYGYEQPCARVRIVSAAHPVPDAGSIAATQQIRQALHGLGADDLVIALISGGGSALLVEPAPGLSLAAKQAVNVALLASGAGIGEINTLRRHLSGVKGGRLALACARAPLCTLLMSDVPGDDPADIASGPTVADASTCAQALAIAQRHAVPLPPLAEQALRSAAWESVKPGDPRLGPHTLRWVATAQGALQAAATLARSWGCQAYVLGDSMEGEARDVAAALAGLVRQAQDHPQPFVRPCVLLSGGETTVSLRTPPAAGARGGRNVTFLLALALALGPQRGVHALAADTDGVDGSAEVAGAWISPDTLARAWAQGLQPQAFLDAHDAHGFFARLGDALVTGPTHTNVNDFRAIYLGAP